MKINYLNQRTYLK